MKNMMIPAITLVLGVAAGSVVTQQGWFANILPMSTAQAKLSAEAAGAETKNVEENKPLYWVAPMDPNYRRDKPGKSPMGMDMVPVYADGGEAEKAGTVKISPVVENNYQMTNGSIVYKDCPSSFSQSPQATAHLLQQHLRYL